MKFNFGISKILILQKMNLIRSNQPIRFSKKNKILDYRDPSNKGGFNENVKTSVKGVGFYR